MSSKLQPELSTLAKATNSAAFVQSSKAEITALYTSCLDQIQNATRIGPVVKQALSQHSDKLDVPKITEKTKQLQSTLSDLKVDLEQIHERSKAAVDNFNSTQDVLAENSNFLFIGQEYSNWMERFSSLVPPLLEELTQATSEAK